MSDYLPISLLGYLIGALNPALLLAKVKGVDVTGEGSGNPGASNAALLFGLPLGLLVAFLDIGKAILAVRLCQRLFPGAAYVRVAAGAACVFGHIFPFYHRFRGGKGFAPYLGLILALDCRFVLYFAVPIILFALVFDYPVLASLVTITTFPLYGALRLGAVTTAWLCLLSLVTLLRHRDNLAELRRGTEARLRHPGNSEYRLKR